MAGLVKMAGAGCLKRLLRDLQELDKSPVANVAAAPLEDNMLEWHCNIRQDDLIYHLILFFSQDYPSRSPSAEFLPRGFLYKSGATRDGLKGTRICLSIFSDFADVHHEWNNLKGEGWSPGYTVQTVLLNLVSFLSDNKTTSDASYFQNLSLSKSFACSDCGHSYTKPYPCFMSKVSDFTEDAVAPPDLKNQDPATTASPGTSPGRIDSELKLGLETSKQAADLDSAFQKFGWEKSALVNTSKRHEIIDYYSRERFQIDGITSEEDLFGYGLVVTGAPGRATVTTPCEFLTVRSFIQMGIAGERRSVMKENILFLLPLYIFPNHGAHIKVRFDEVMKDLAGHVMTIGSIDPPVADVVLKALPNIMCSTLVYLFKELERDSEDRLNGYFALHRLFLWALDTYPSLQEKLEEMIQDFIQNERQRTKSFCPNIGNWLMLLVGSLKFRWVDVAEAYLKECFRRNVAWYVKDDRCLADANISQDYRLKHTFQRTRVSRNLLAFQVVFLDIAWPSGLSRADVVNRYDDNWGFPTADMITCMKTQCAGIRNDIKNYGEWYRLLKLPVPSDTELFENLLDALLYAQSTHGYHWL